MFLISNYSNGWEAAFVGALQGGFIFLCIVIYRHFRKKRDAKKKIEEAEQRKVSSFIEGRTDSNSDISNTPKSGKEYLWAVYDEMKEKCNPKNYMNPYNHEKVRVANEIYSSLVLMSNDSLSEEAIMLLRHRAIVELGLVFDTKAIYEYLSKKCNPSNFINPYDAEKVNDANDIYAKIQQNKENIEQLEKIRDEATAIGILSESWLPANRTEQLVSVLGNWKASKPESFIRIILTKSDKFRYYLEKKAGHQWERCVELEQTDNSPWGILFEFKEVDCSEITYQIKSNSGDLVKFRNYAVVETFKKIDV